MNKTTLRTLTFSLTILLFATACGPSKKVAAGEPDESMTSKKILALHRKSDPDFKTLATRLQVRYDDGETTQSVTVSMRMEREKTIWVSASVLGITLAKILITPDSVQYYETIGNTYFDGDFSLLSAWLGTEIDYTIAENILLGNTLYPLDAKNHSAAVFEGNYRLEPKQQQSFLQFVYSINPANFKVASQEVIQPMEQRVMVAKYPEYQEVDGEFFPKKLELDVIENTQKTKIRIEYRRIERNPKLRFPFSIPDNYDEIRID